MEPSTIAMSRRGRHGEYLYDGCLYVGSRFVDEEGQDPFQRDQRYGAGRKLMIVTPRRTIILPVKACPPYEDRTADMTFEDFFPLISMWWCRGHSGRYAMTSRTGAHRSHCMRKGRDDYDGSTVYMPVVQKIKENLVRNGLVPATGHGPYLQVQDLALSDPLYRKILRRLPEEEGTEPRAGPAGPAAAIGEICCVETSAQDRRKMPVFQFGGWPSGRYLASYLYQDLSISAILWLQRKIRWAIGTASMIRCRKRRWNAGRRDNWSNTGKVKGYSP